MKRPAIADHLAALPVPPANKEWRRVKKGETVPAGRFTYVSDNGLITSEPTLVAGVINGQYGHNHFWYLATRRKNSKKKLAPKS